MHFRSVTNAAWFLRPADASNVPMHALVGVCAAVLQPTPSVWSGFVAHLNELVAAGELSDDESIAVVASEFTRLELSDIEPDADVEATTVREIVQRVRTEEQTHFREILHQERQRREESERETATARLELAATKGEVRESADNLASLVSNVVFAVVFLVLAVGAFLTIPSKWSDATKVHQVGSVLWWSCVVIFVLCSVLGFTRRLQVLNRVRLFFVGGPRGFCQRHGKSYLTPSKVWWGGRRGRLADRPRYSISVSLGGVPLVLPRRGSPSTHRSRGWLRSTRSFRTASAPNQFPTRPIRARAWMKQRYWVAPACTSELHHGRGPGTARPFDDAGGDGTQAPPCRRTRPRG